MVRYKGDGTVVPLATWAAAGDHPPLPDRWPIEVGDPLDRVARALGPVWVEDWSSETGPVSELVRQVGARSSVGVPILLDGRLWGALAVHSKGAPLPRETEARLFNFAQLLASAMSGARARAEVQRLADEQAALRRVATLVAQESSPSEVFALIAEELHGLLQVDDSRMIRFDADGLATVVAGTGQFQAAIAVGTQLRLDGTTLGATVYRTGRVARLDDYSDVTGTVGDIVRKAGVRSGVGTPIVVDGRPWGVMIVASRRPEPLPADTEERVQSFCELAATAISNSEARHELRGLAEEQAALRRVAMLVAQESAPTEVFSKVAEELATLLGMERTLVLRYEDPGA